jgi:hypothetical protein
MDASARLGRLAWQRCLGCCFVVGERVVDAGDESDADGAVVAVAGQAEHAGAPDRCFLDAVQS